MTDIHVAIIHGIGKNEAGYADKLIRGVRKAFTARIRKLAGEDAAAEARITFKPIVWDDILGKNQEKLKVILERTQQQRKRKTFLGVLTAIGVVPLIIMAIFFRVFFRHPLLSGLLALALGYLLYHFGPKFYNQLRSGIAAEYVGDIIGYLNEDAKKKIQARIKEELVSLGAEGAPVTFVAHSLGTVIASDFIWDCQKHGLMERFTLGNFFTMGSPLVLFALRCGAKLFNRPIHIAAPGRWVNILDTDDPIAYPLKPLNNEYEATVLADREVNVGPLGLAHIRYWNAQTVHTIIAHKLALDWLRANDRLDPNTVEHLSHSYDTDQT